MKVADLFLSIYDKLPDLDPPIDEVIEIQPNVYLINPYIYPLPIKHYDDQDDAYDDINKFIDNFALDNNIPFDYYSKIPIFLHILFSCLSNILSKN